MGRLDGKVRGSEKRRDVQSRSEEANRGVELMAVDERPGKTAHIPRMTHHVWPSDQQKSPRRINEPPRLHQLHQALLPAQPADEYANDGRRRDVEGAPRRQALIEGRRPKLC